MRIYMLVMIGVLGVVGTPHASREHRASHAPNAEYGARVDSAKTESRSTQSNIARVFAKDSFWVRQWMRGYEAESDMFIEPRRMVISGDKVLVLDLGTRDVRALDLATGANRLHLVSRQGSGPGEFRKPTGLAAAPNGFAISDEGNARISAYDGKARLLWDMPIPDGYSSSFCVLQDNTVLWKLRGAHNALLITDTTGRKLSTRSLPWKDDSTQSLTSEAKVAGPTSRGECVFAQVFGSTFAIVPRVGAVQAVSYVEVLAPTMVKTSERIMEQQGKTALVLKPEIAQSKPSATDAMIRGDTLIVRFSGETRQANRLLDYYLLPSGRYLYSRKRPVYVTAIAVGANGTFYVAQIGNENSGVSAIRPSFTRPPKQPAKTAKRTANTRR